MRIDVSVVKRLRLLLAHLLSVSRVVGKMSGKDVKIVMS